MFLVYPCTRCHRPLRVLARHAGKTLHCPDCATAFVVPVANPTQSLPTPPANRERPVPLPEPVEAVNTPPRADRSFILPWVLLAPAVLALALRQWVGHGVLVPALGVTLGSLCLLVGQRSRWPISRRVVGSLSLAILGHGLTLASPLADAPQRSHPRIAEPPMVATRTAPNMLPTVPSTAADPNLSPTANALMRSRLQVKPTHPVARDLLFSGHLGELLTLSICPRPDGAPLALTTTVASQLKIFSYPEFQLRAAYRLSQPGYRAVVDGRRGVLWVAACPSESLRVNSYGDPPRGRADLHVYDIPSEAKTDALSPRRVLPLGGDVLELATTPDQETLFYLAQKPEGIRLGRIDAGRQAVDREVSLPAAIGTLCLTSDGQTLYAAGDRLVLVLDPATLETRRRVEVPVDVRCLAAANDGFLFLAGQGKWSRLTRLDLRGPHADLYQWPARLHGRVYLKLAPDQHRLYTGTSSPLTEQIDSLLIRGHPEKMPRVLAIAASGTEGVVRGEFFVTPESRFLVNRWGTVFRLAEVAPPAGSEWLNSSSLTLRNPRGPGQ